MRVTVLELPARWGDPEGALRLVSGVLAEGPATDLVLLPEASLSGYVSPRGDFDLTPHAETAGGPTSRAIAELARRHHTVVVAPLVLREGTCVWNAMVAFDDRGELLFTYRKRHPWIPETWATPGTDALPVVHIVDTTVTICICYDVHFVSSEMGPALDASDLLLFPSAWVDDSPRDLRDALLPRLARRHRIAVANANWARGVVAVPGQGRSRILDAAGVELVRVDDAARAHGEIGRIDAVVVPSARA
ncbi:MAG: carbon-nitrogen hydrolase family protein [Deltaproteobacteria bacterium]|nr:carbon-nitrogen hydrolase family protein [Deltaproteobacteria bacterium]